MILRRYYLGREPTLAVAADRATIQIYVDDRTLTAELTATGFTIVKEPAKPAPVDPGAFEVSDFGAFDRLSWPGGATACAHDATLGLAEGRHAAWIEGKDLHLVDTQLDKQLTLAGIAYFGLETKVTIGIDRRLYLHGKHVAVLELDDVLAQFGATRVELEVQAFYPLRREKPDRTFVVDYVLQDASLSSDEGTREYLKLPGFYGLTRGMHVRLRDRLYEGGYRVLVVPGKPPVELRPLPGPYTVEANITATEPRDPIRGGAQAPQAPLRERELDTLLAQLADDPDDATRDILVDLWTDAGEPFATAIAQLRAGDGSGDMRGQALGLLDSFLTEIGLVGGLPARATLATEPPRDPSLVDAACTDQRLGLFRELRIGEGPVDIYTRLVSSPRAVALRAISGSNPRILRGLMGAHRTQITQIYDLKLAAKDTIVALADPAFDRVRDLWLEVEHRFFGKQLEWIARDEAGFWRRAPRHLHISEKSDRVENLEPLIRAAWANLPLAAITAGKLTLTR